MPHRAHTEPSRIRVVPRNSRWEVEADGTTIPLLDWTWCKERALARAVERARELLDAGAPDVVIVVERTDGTVEQTARAA